MWLALYSIVLRTLLKRFFRATNFLLRFYSRTGILSFFFIFSLNRGYGSSKILFNPKVRELNLKKIIHFIQKRIPMLREDTLVE